MIRIEKNIMPANNSFISFDPQEISIMASHINKLKLNKDEEKIKNLIKITRIKKLTIAALIPHVTFSIQIFIFFCLKSKIYLIRRHPNQKIKKKKKIH